MNVWDEILTRVETKVNRHSFYTWFKPTTFLAVDAGRTLLLDREQMIVQANDAGIAIAGYSAEE